MAREIRVSPVAAAQRESLVRGVEVRDGVVEECEASAARAEQTGNELFGLRWGGPDQRRPDRGGVLTGRDERAVADVKAPSERRRRGRVLPQLVQRRWMLHQPLQSGLVDRQHTEVDQRRRTGA